MLLDEDLVIVARIFLYGIIAALLVFKYVHFRIYKSSHTKEFLRFKFLYPYGQRERFATGSNSKRIFMTNSNRILYVIYMLAGLLVMLLVIPKLA